MDKNKHITLDDVLTKLMADNAVLTESELDMVCGGSEPPLLDSCHPAAEPTI